MAMYEVTMKDRPVERVAEVDAYQQEGPMTTFFRTGDDRRTIDSWSTRVASYRTTELLIIRRLTEPDTTVSELTALPRRTA
jgi:hypothetical protein